MQKIILVVLFIAVAGNLFAQSANIPVKFDGQIRIRGEADGRDFNNDSDINNYTLLRTRFGAMVEPLQNVRVYIQIQDSRAFGEEASTLANTANLDLHQAFFEVTNLWDKPITLKAGRQELVYGNERLIGAVGWSNVGRSFDGMKWTIGEKNPFDLFWMLLDESDTPVTGAATPGAVQGSEDRGSYFYGAYYQYRTNSRFLFDAYGLYQLDLFETVSGNADLQRATLGTYNKWWLGSPLGFESEAALQFGKRRGQDVLAFMLTGAVSYTFQSARKPSISLGYDFLSGMNAGDEDYKVFDNLFGTNHKFYGFMDYFVSIPVNTGGRGLQDLMLKASFPISNSWQANVHFHNFRAAKGAEKDFGNELDLIFNYKYNEVASFTLGVGIFAPGDLIETRFLNDDIGFWSYSTILVTF